MMNCICEYSSIIQHCWAVFNITLQQWKSPSVTSVHMQLFSAAFLIAFILITKLTSGNCVCSGIYVSMLFSCSMQFTETCIVICVIAERSNHVQFFIERKRIRWWLMEVLRSTNYNNLRRFVQMETFWIQLSSAVASPLSHFTGGSNRNCSHGPLHSRWAHE